MKIHCAKMLSHSSPMDSFIADFHATVARHAGMRLTRQNEILVRGIVGSVVRRAFMCGILPAETRLVAMRTLDGMVFRVLCETGLIAEAFVSGPCPRLRRRRPRTSSQSVKGSAGAYPSAETDAGPPVSRPRCRIGPAAESGNKRGCPPE